MQQNTIKTTPIFSLRFPRQVRNILQQCRWRMSRMIENVLSNFFKKQEQQKLDRMYAAFRECQGSGSPDITDASTTIDETLYGDEGAWKGQPAE